MHTYRNASLWMKRILGTLLLTSCQQTRQQIHNIQVDSKPIAHMVAQNRAKQLAIKDTQDKLRNSILEAWNENPDLADPELILKNITQSYAEFNRIKQFFFKTRKKPTHTTAWLSHRNTKNGSNA